MRGKRNRRSASTGTSKGHQRGMFLQGGTPPRRESGGPVSERGKWAERGFRPAGGGQKRRRKPQLDRRPTFEPLEVRSLLAIDISDFQLVVDNGSSSSDAITSDARVSGVVGGTFDSPQATHAGIQFDHNGDSVVDGAVSSTTIAATFSYDPQLSGLASGQAVSLRYRAVEKDASGGVVATGAWSSFSFTFAESPRGAIDVRQGTTAVLHNETSLSFGAAPSARRSRRR